MKQYLLLAALFFLGLPSYAQFYLPGDNPSRLRWYSVETAHYELIFPQGADSLARSYGRALEQFRIPVGRSLGNMTPGMSRRSKFPVVLHAFNTYANGSVGWAPSRMDLFTHAESYGAEPVPWNIQLTSHEPRHQAQLQFGQRGVLPWLAGEMWAPVYWQLYIEQALAEGDAVVGETGLARGTRARTADFLNYYQVALAQGAERSWDRWRNGSFKHYTPNHYALGYVTLAGARTLYEDPLILREAIDLAWKKPWMVAPYNTQKIISQHAGKPFKVAFKDILQEFNTVWQQQSAQREPFMPMEEVLPARDYALEYSTPQWTQDGILALRESYLKPTDLVRIQGGKVRVLRAFAAHHSSLFLHAGSGRVYWSETRRHPRWGLDGSSVICRYDLSSDRVTTLTKGTRYYNPQPSPEGDRLSVVEYPVEGGSALVVLSAEEGKVLRRAPLPEGVQGTESAWLGEDIYVLGNSRGGTGLYRLSPDGNWAQVLEPSEQKMVNLASADNHLEWVSDRSGVNELYHFYPAEGRLLQLTSTPFGATDFTSDGEQLYYVAQALEGRPLYKTPLAALQPRSVEWTALAAHPIEDALTAQEQALGPEPDLDAAVPVSAPRRYRKLSHPLRLHSWLPLYVNYDAVKSGSMDFSFDTAAPGLSGYFQNTLGTFSGMLGYALAPDPDRTSAWRSSLHLQMVYTGLYPVFEFNMHIGEELSRFYLVQQLSDGQSTINRASAILQDTPQVRGTIRSYIPLNFNRGGVLYGFTPQLQYSFSNNFFASSPQPLQTNGRLEDIPVRYSFSEQPAPSSGPALQHFSASLRGYVMTRRAASQTYPRWGLGAEVGIGLRPGLEKYYAPNTYLYAYGYLPGITRTQGFRWTFTGQQKMQQGNLIGELYAGVLPRGFSGVSGASSLVGQYFSWQWRATADYAIPIYVGDISIPVIAYIRNFLLTPHADYMGLPEGFNLWSAGADLSARLSRILFIPFDASVGLSFSYRGGTLLPYLQTSRPWSLSLIFGVDF